MSRTLTLTPENLAVLIAAGHPLYIVKAPDGPQWDYKQPITVDEVPGLLFKRQLIMYGNKGHKEALELEVTAGTPPSRAELLGKTLRQG
ncbi:MAG: hypothetical protein ACOY94_02515 [Bacillota bacterium]